MDHVYIGTQIFTTTKFDEISQVELEIKSSNFDFDYGFDTDKKYIDQIHCLMHLYAILPEDEIYSCNFTNYFRPPSFIKRESGKLLLVAAASLIISFIYPLSYWLITYAQAVQYERLTQEYTLLYNQKNSREATIKNKISKIDKTNKLLTIEEKNYKEKKNTLIKIHDVKVNYPMKAKYLSILTKDLNKFSVNLESLSYIESDDSKQFILNLISSNNRRITKLIGHLTKTHYGKFDFSLKNISYDNKSKKYTSILKVKLL